MKPVLISDFDGVIVDGMEEYWWSARQVAADLLPAQAVLPQAVPASFRALRPKVLHGWEMGVLAAALAGYGAELEAFERDYPQALAQSLDGLGWSAEQLTESLDRVRHGAIATDRQAWVARHRPYPWMLACLQRLQRQGEPWRVLTTKSEAFTAELLACHGLTPEAIHGREQGPKPQVLLRLREEGVWSDEVLFLEDRRLTLEAVQATPGLSGVRGVLASWGYLQPGDDENLPPGLAVVRQEQLAQWP